MIDAALLQHIQSRALSRIGRTGAEQFDLYANTELLLAGHTIQAQHQQIELVQDTVMVFVDEHPRLNWGHPCRYLLFSPQDAGVYAEVPAAFPPYLGDEPDSYVLFQRAVVPPAPEPVRQLPTRRPTPHPVRAGRHAVLFSGLSDWRHVNDLEFLYRCLVDSYGFNPDDIIVLNYDGTLGYNRAPDPIPPWPGDNTPYRMTVRGKGTKADLEGVLHELRRRLKPEHLLVLHTNNHGYSDDRGTFMSVKEGPKVYVSDLARWVAGLPAFRSLVVMMEQCRAGAFGQPLIDASPARYTNFCSACAAGQSSALGEHFDPFARDWVAAMHLSAPYGTALAHNPDGDNNERITAREAFTYADAVKDPQDTPVYVASGRNADDCDLWGA